MDNGWMDRRIHNGYGYIMDKEMDQEKRLEKISYFWLRQNLLNFPIFFS